MNAALDACRYSLFAIAEIHRLGFNNVRMMPFWENRTWSLLIGDESAFDNNFGAYIPPQNRRQCIRLEPTWKPRFAAKVCEPWEIAAQIIANFPRNFDKRAPEATAYTHWFKSLVTHLAIHPTVIPTVSLDGSYATVWIAQLICESHTKLEPISKFPPPPNGSYDAKVDKAIDSLILIAQPRPADAPSLIWPISRSTDSILGKWYDDNPPSEPKEVR